MIDLDSPRWAELGSRGLVDGLLVRDVVRDLTRRIRGGAGSMDAWLALFDLFHQSSYEAAAVAALPHLLALTAEHDVARAGALILVGLLEVGGHTDPTRIPEDVLAEHRRARAVIRSWSWDVLQRHRSIASRAEVQWWECLLQGFVGLRQRTSLAADLCLNLTDGAGLDATLRCAGCREWLFVEVEPISGGGWLRAVSRKRSRNDARREDLIDEAAARAAAAALVERGAPFLAAADPEWPLDATAAVMAAAADRVGWREPLEKLAMLFQRVSCPGCEVVFEPTRVADDRASRVPL